MHQNARNRTPKLFLEARTSLVGLIRGGIRGGGGFSPWCLFDMLLFESLDVYNFHMGINSWRMMLGTGFRAAH